MATSNGDNKLRTDRRSRMKGLVGGVSVVVLLAVVLVACGGDEASGDRFTRDDIVATMSGEGFSGEEDTLVDGTPRWLGRGPDGAILEVVSAADAPDSVSLTVAASAEGGELVGTFLNTWAPGSTEFFRSVLDEAQTGGDQDQQRDIGERSVRVQTLAASDGALVVTTIYR